MNGSKAQLQNQNLSDLGDLRGKKPFARDERRRFVVSSPEPVAGKNRQTAVAATLERTRRFPTHAARFFELTTDSRLPATIRVQLNHGEPGDDEKRLAEIAEDFLQKNSFNAEIAEHAEKNLDDV